MITCKEDLIGTEFKVTCKEEADLLKEKCKSLGIEHATWSSCNYTGGVMRGLIGKDLGTHHSCKLLFTGRSECDDSMDEFRALRFISIKDLKPKPTKFVKVEESIFDLREEFERGELYCKNLCASDDYTKLNTEVALFGCAAAGNVYRKVEVDWVESVIGLVPVGYGIDRSFSHRLGIAGSYNKEQALTLANAIIASLTEKPE